MLVSSIIMLEPRVLQQLDGWTLPQKVLQEMTTRGASMAKQPLQHSTSSVPVGSQKTCGRCSWEWCGGQVEAGRVHDDCQMYDRELELIEA